MAFETSYFISALGGRITLDSVIKQTQTSNNKITTHAIEAGANISDHSEDSGGNLNLEVVLTDDNISPSDPSSAFILPVSLRLTTMDEWRSNGILLTYVSPRKVIPSLLIESVTESVNQAHGWGVSYTMKLKKVRLFGIVTRDINLPTTALRLLKKGLTAGITESATALVRGDIGF